MTAKTYPIPDEALDDRLGVVGTSGSGKTYNVGTAIERLLDDGRRVGIVDPLGVTWGLRLKADGKVQTPWPLIIFGGPHGDLPLSENAGALIGETCASMAESFILDLSELGTRAAERRFMLAYLSTLYRHQAGEPLHLVLDEADMWAPQNVQDKDGGALKLLATVETIVRRGRVKGFIPWLITQRPAVLNKNVLSQVDGLIAMKLTSSQDRAALAAWIEGQADKADARRILDSLPSLKLGTGVVWIPSRGILETSTFPKKRTFDSSRTPKRGEVRQNVTLKPVNVDKIREKLATVEHEVSANDPAKLKARIAELERAARSRGKDAIDALAAPTKAELIEAKRQGVQIGTGHLKEAMAGLKDVMLERIRAELTAVIEREIARPTKIPPAPAIAAKPASVSRETSSTWSGTAADAKGTATLAIVFDPHNGSVVASGSPKATDLTPYQRKILESIAFWNALGMKAPTRTQVALAAGVSPSSSTFEKYIRELRTAGLIEIPAPLKLMLTSAAGRVAIENLGTVRERLAKVLTPYQAKIVDALPRDGSGMSRDELAAAIEQSSTSSTFEKYIRTLRSLGIVTLPEAGSVAVEAWVWQ